MPSVIAAFRLPLAVKERQNSLRKGAGQPVRRGVPGAAMSLLEGVPAWAAPREVTERAWQLRVVTVYSSNSWKEDGVAFKM